MTRFAWTQVCCEGCWQARNPGREPYRRDGQSPAPCAFCGEPTASGIFVRLYPSEIERQQATLVASAPETADRELVREIVAERPRRLFQQCAFCSAPCQGEACAAHKDLLETDSHYAMRGAP